MHFRFVGRLVGLALTNKIDFEIDLTRSFLKHILKKPLYISDFEDIDVIMGRNLLWIIENDINNCDIMYCVENSSLGING